MGTPSWNSRWGWLVAATCAVALAGAFLSAEARPLDTPPAAGCADLIRAAAPPAGSGGCSVG